MKKLLIFSLIFYFTFNLSLTFSQFGKNIVQYEKFDWKYIQSEHFDIYYNKGSKRLAEFAAMSIERALISVQNTLRYRINSRIKLIIYDTHNEFQQTNVISQFMTEGIGGVTELGKNRIVAPFQGDYSQFDHVLHHELVHAVMNQMFYGGTFQTALRSGNLGKIPIWVSEGIAEYESLGGYNFETDMFMRDISLNEKLIDLKDMNNYFAYRGGQTFFWYIAKKYGSQKVGDFINRLKVNTDINSTFKSAFNMTLEEFSEEFKNDLKEYYWPDIAIFKNPKEFAERITNHTKEDNFYNSSPSISPDGKQMAYISAPNGLFSIMIKNLDPKNKNEAPRKLISSFRQQDFEDLNILTPGISWNPEGNKLAISAKAGGEDAIFIVDVESGDYKKLTFDLKSLTSVSWSPDGEKLAFIASKLGQSDIYVYNFNNAELINLTDDVFTDLNPIWSPNSNEIYFISDRGNNLSTGLNVDKFFIWNHNFDQRDIFKINSNTKEIERITFTPQDNKTSLVISNDNKNLFFTSDNNGILNIYNLNLENKRIIPITNSQTGISQLSISKDNSKMLFSTMIEGAYDIYIMRFPQSIKLEQDTLPYTKFKQNLLNKEQIINEISELDTTEKENDLQKKVYGNFEINFNRQKLINKNLDADESLLNDYSNIANNDSIPVFIEKDYKISFSPDFISGDPSFNTFWGLQGTTQLLFSDVLGDHKIYLLANLLLDLKNSNFYAAYLYQPEIIDYMVAGYHSAGYVNYGYDTLGNNLLYRFRNFGVDLSASYPLDIFNRIEWGISFKNASKENIYNTSEPSISRFLFIPESRFVHDDVLYGIFSPILGQRYYIGFMGTPKFSENSIGFLSITADYRKYFQISDLTSFAIRSAVGMSFGPNPQNFYLGGTEYWINSFFAFDRIPLNTPEDFAFINSSFVMPLRGFAVGEISGNRYFLANFEFRFPFIGWLLATPIPIAQAFMAGVFFDVGGAWSGDWSSFKSTKIDYQGRTVPNNLLMSAGVGLRTGLLGIPVKMDIAWANYFYKWSEPKYLFSLGFDF